MKNLAYLFILFLTSCGCFERPSCSTNDDTYTKTVLTIKDGDDSDEILQKSLEYAYFEGQKDAINGDVRIKLLSENNTYIWIKSPWNSGKAALFIPTAENTKLERVNN